MEKIPSSNPKASWYFSCLIISGVFLLFSILSPSYVDSAEEIFYDDFLGYAANFDFALAWSPGYDSGSAVSIWGLVYDGLKVPQPWCAGSSDTSELYVHYDDNMDTSMQRQIDLSGYQNPYLTFHYYFQTPSTGEGDYLQVKVNGNTVWVHNAADGFHDWAGAIKEQVDLSSYQGQIITLQFRFVSDSSGSDAHGAFVDDIGVYGDIATTNTAPEFTGWTAPIDGSTESTFTYRVKYSDDDGDPPTEINVIIDGNTNNPIPLSLESGEPPVDGWYSVNIPGSALGVGSNHTYKYTCSDGIDSCSSLIRYGPVVAPTIYDLSVSASSSLDTEIAAHGEIVSIMVRFENQGNAPVNNVPYRIFLQTDIGDSGDPRQQYSEYSDAWSIILAEGNTDAISDGSDDVYWHYSRIPETLNPGKAYLIVFEIDPDNTIGEDSSDLIDNVSFEYLHITDEKREENLGNGCFGFSYIRYDPVNTAIGNFVLSETDLTLPGPGMNFSFFRTYNSQSGKDGPIGAYWTHNYNAHFYKDTEPDGNEDSVTNGKITLVLGDGRQVKFTQNGEVFDPPLGNDDTLVVNQDNTYTYTPQSKRKSYTFSSDGYLTEIRDRNNNIITLQYTGDLLTTVVDTAGRAVIISYDTFGGRDRIVSVNGPGRASVQYGYDSKGNLISVIDPEEHETKYDYVTDHEDPHLLHSVTNGRNIVRVRNYYGLPDGTETPNGYHIVRQVHADGSENLYRYNTSTKITTITEPNNVEVEHHHDDRFRVIKEVDGEGNQLYNSFNDMGYKEWVQDKRGYKTYFTYDDNGNVLTRQDPDGIVTKFEYNPDNSIKLKRDDYYGLNYLWSYDYDPDGNLLTVADPENRITTFTYTSQGQVETKVDPNQNTTYYYYEDQYLNLTKVIDSEGGIISSIYDDAGRKESVNDTTDPTLAISYVYDNNDNVKEIHDSEGSQYFQYDENSNKRQETNRRGSTTYYEYDSRDRLETIRDTYNRTTSKTYFQTNLDLVKTKTDQWGNVTSYAYNSMGQVETATNPDLQIVSYEYDQNGNKIAMNDPAGNRWEYSYDNRNRIIAEKDPLNNTTKREYDRLGFLKSTTNTKNQKTSFTYNKVGELLSVTDAKDGSSIFSYDDNGNRLSETDARNNTVGYEYDTLNRLKKITDRNQQDTAFTWMAGLNSAILKTRTDGNLVTTTNNLYPDKRRIQSVSYSDGEPGVTFTHDKNGNVLTMTDSVGTTTYQYDDLDRITSVEDPFGNVVGYRYDDANHTKTIFYPDLKEVVYQFDKMSRLSTVTDWLGYITTYSYNNRGLLDSITNSLGTTTTYHYDNDGRLIKTEAKTSTDTLIASYDLSLDGLGNRINIGMNVPLVGVPAASSATASYDLENQIIDRDDHTYTFDDGGRIASDSDGATNINYTFNNSDRLTDISDGANNYQYLYNGSGDRLASSENGTQTRYILNLAATMSQVFCETDESGNILSYYVHGAGLLYKILPDGTRYHYHFDPLGSTIAITDASETVTDSYAYGPYGSLLDRRGSTENPFTFVGQYGVMQEEDGLYFMRARFYDSTTKRFLSRDPVKGKNYDTQGLNPFLYTGANPTVFTDPKGLQKKGKDYNADPFSKDIVERRIWFRKYVIEPIVWCNQKGADIMYSIPVPSTSTSYTDENKKLTPLDKSMNYAQQNGGDIMNSANNVGCEFDGIRSAGNQLCGNDVSTLEGQNRQREKMANLKSDDGHDSPLAFFWNNPVVKNPAEYGTEGLLLSEEDKWNSKNNGNNN